MTETADEQAAPPQSAEPKRVLEGPTEDQLPDDADLQTYGHFLNQHPDDLQVVEADAEGSPEPADGSAVAEPAPDEGKLYAGKYKSDEDLERAYLELQRAHGSLANEVGQLRQSFVDQQPQPQAAPFPSAGGEMIEQAIEENPAAVAEWARSNNNPFVYDRAIRAWSDLDPLGAGRYERALERDQWQREITQQFQPHLAAGVNAASQMGLQQALNQAMGEHDDFAQVIGAIDPDGIPRLLEGNPVAQEVIGTALSSNDVTKMKGAYTLVYQLAKANQVGVLNEHAARAAAEAQETARKDKLAATVASASTTTPPEIPETEEQRMSRVVDRYAGRSLRDGWTGRDSRR